ncbi:MAG: hypothetical protein GX881_08025 [Firmicutes bacterium]|nr:hypothetical protein [Bacillota bacterium]
MNEREKLVLRNGVLLARMREMRELARVTNRDRRKFDFLCRIFDRNVAAIEGLDTLSRIRGSLQQRERRRAVAMREKRAAARASKATVTNDPRGWKTPAYLYEEVPPWAVDPEKRKAADRMLMFCIIDLNLTSKLRVRWCNEYEPGNPDKPRLFSENTTFSNDGQMHGCILRRGCVVLDDTIWVNHERKLDAIPQTVAHEARHVYQVLHEGTLKAHGKEADMERDANEYAKQALNAYRFTDRRPGRFYDSTKKAILTK